MGINFSATRSQGSASHLEEALLSPRVSGGLLPARRRSYPDVRDAVFESMAVPPNENVWVGSLEQGGVPEGFVDIEQWLAHLPLCFHPEGGHVCVRRHTEEEQSIYDAFENLRGADLSENGVVRAFVKGESREVYDALATLVRLKVLDVCRNPSHSLRAGAGAGMSLLHEMARYGTEAPADGSPSANGGVSLRERFRMLKDAGVDLNLPDPDDALTTPLHAATRRNNWQAVKALLDNDANPEPANAQGATPLILAAEKGAHEAMRALLESRADPNVRGRSAAEPDDVVAPIHLAVKKRVGGFAGVQELLNHGADVMLQSRRNGWTPFHYAVLTHQFRNAQALLAQGADPDIVDHEGNTALHIACNRRDAEAIAKLLEFGADPNRDDAAGQKPLYRAIRHFNDVETIARLIEKGADVNADNRVVRNPSESYYGWTQYALRRPALHLVCDFEYSIVPRNLDFDYLARVGKLLLRHGADAMQRDLKTGDTALHVAARRANQKMVEVLVTTGKVDIDARNHQQKRAIDIAGRMGYGDLFEYLRRMGAKGPYNFTPPASGGAGGGA